MSAEHEPGDGDRPAGAPRYGEGEHASGTAGRSERHSRPPGDRLPFERIVPDLLKRGLEAGRGSSMPREIAGYLVTQFSEAREGIVTAVAQEVGRFLRQADIASELRNVLTGLEVEATVRLNFRRKKPEEVEDGGGDAPDPGEEGPTAAPPRSGSTPPSKPPPAR